MEGHLIGNHTWDHAALLISDDVNVIEKLAQANDVITEILGTSPTLFRGSYGSVDARVERLAATLGLTHMGWGVETKDFSAPDIETIINAVLGARWGELVLLHDGNGAIPNGPNGRPKTVEALARALPALRERA